METFLKQREWEDNVLSVLHNAGPPVRHFSKEHFLKRCPVRAPWSEASLNNIIWDNAPFVYTPFLGSFPEENEWDKALSACVLQIWKLLWKTANETGSETATSLGWTTSPWKLSEQHFSSFFTLEAFLKKVHWDVLFVLKSQNYIIIILHGFGACQKKCKTDDLEASRKTTHLSILHIWKLL